MSYDAVVVLSFGGPEGPDDVMPFLRNVTRGRNVPDERLATVAKQYELFEGRSPLNDHCRSLVKALRRDLGDSGISLPVYWGNRNWHPFLSDTVEAMRSDGVTNALVYVTSAFGSYSGCRQYRQDMAAARKSVGDGAPMLSKLRLFYNHPGFIAAQADRITQSLADAGLSVSDGCLPDGWVVAFTAHSLPLSQSTSCDYVDQLNEAARLVSHSAGITSTAHEVVYQSRSGPPSVPWLGPDINDHLGSLAATGATGVLVVPIGFVSDHAEVLFDLDIQAKATATELGLQMVRVPSVGNHARFVHMITELVGERIDAAEGTQPVRRLWVGSDGAWPDQCPDGHCQPPGSGPPGR